MLRPDKQVNRTQVAAQRRAPNQPTCVDVPFSGSEDIIVRLPAAPLQLNIFATDATGETAPWFDDMWWMELIGRYADEALTVVIIPTPAALLHPVVLHHLEMIFRVVPGWRMAGYAFVDDLQTLDEWELAARSAYHELRLLDRLRNPSLPTRMEVKPLDEVIGEIRRAQQRMSAKRPTIIRLPADTELSGFPVNAAATLMADRGSTSAFGVSSLQS